MSKRLKEHINGNSKKENEDRSEKIGRKILLKGSISTLKMMVLRRWKIHTFRLRAKGDNVYFIFRF